jgi:GNAT superfamily N-acetyltransferase
MTNAQPGFRPYESSDRAACLALFDENCPEYFAPGERASYVAFLDKSADDYAVYVFAGKVAGAYGLCAESKGVMSLRWVVIARSAQKQGVGRTIMNRVLAALRALKVKKLEIAGSQKSAPFFARFGARELKTTPDGWGPGMHRVDMELLP